MNYTEINPEFKNEFFKLVTEAKNIIITSHINPDEDSVACVLGVYDILSKKFPDKNFRMVYLGERTLRFQTFTNFDKVEFLNEESLKSVTADLVILLDVAQFARSGAIFLQNTKTICIDHHASTPDTFTLSLIMPGFSSCAELVYRVFDGEFDLSKSLAETLLMGILGDTANFLFLKPSQASTLDVAKILIQIAEISPDELRSRYSGISTREFTILQEFFKNSAYKEISNWPQFQFSFIDRNFAKNYSDNEISTASHMYMSFCLRKTTGYNWGFVLSPRAEGYCSISARSMPGSVNVRDLQERLGTGGGHDRAAGGAFKKEATDRDAIECLEKIFDFMQNNKPLLN